MPLSKVVLATSGLVLSVLCSAACRSPARSISPIIYAQNDEAAAAMRGAPLILAVKITSAKWTGDMRNVAKPAEVGGPMTPTIPLHLARMQAAVLFTVHGSAGNSVEFYSWVWASGSHGGPRLFRPRPGSSHVVFLREEGEYLHTVGDYPSYDLELPARWLPSLRSAWNSNDQIDVDPIERLIALRLRAEFEGLSENELRVSAASQAPLDSPYLPDWPDLIRLGGPLLIATQLDDICRHSMNWSARFAACIVVAQSFPGRCKAYDFAHDMTVERPWLGGDTIVRALNQCHEQTRGLITDIRTDAPPRWPFYGWKVTPKHRRETMRVYASAVDSEVHLAACQVAEKLPETRDIPECSTATNLFRK